MNELKFELESLISQGYLSKYEQKSEKEIHFSYNSDTILPHIIKIINNQYHVFLKAFDDNYFEYFQPDPFNTPLEVYGHLLGQTGTFFNEENY